MRFDSFRPARLVLLPIFVLALYGCGRATSPVGAPPMVVPKSAVTGTVADTNGAVIAGASVTLRDTHGVPAPAGARRPAPAAAQHDILIETTDANGGYMFEPVPAGDYIVSAEASGYVTGVVQITLVTLGAPNTVDTVTVDLALTPAAPFAAQGPGAGP